MFSSTHTLKMKFYPWCLIGELSLCANIVHFKRVTCCGGSNCTETPPHTHTLSGCALQFLQAQVPNAQPTEM